MGTIAHEERQLSREVHKWAKKIPSGHLLKLAKTEAQIKHWLELHAVADTLSLLLQSRFGAGFGNPARRKLDAGEISEKNYQTLMALTDLFSALWHLVQSGWEYLDNDLAVPLKVARMKHPRNEVELFRMAFTDYFDGQMRQSFAFHEMTLKEAKETTRLVRQEQWEYDGPGIQQETRNALSEKTTKILQDSNGQMSLVSAIVEICGSKKSDPSLQNLYHDFRRKTALVADLIESRVTRTIKGKEKSAKSFRWLNGEKQHWVQNKWQNSS